MCVSTILPELATIKEFYPTALNILRAYKECPYESVKVVLLGQDPYFDGSATGLCFDNYKSKKISPSLRNIIKEADDDLDLHNICLTDKESYFNHLPSQGVLLINTALTVVPGKAESHTELWKPFTNEIFKVLNQKDNIVWILLGNYAKSYKSLINNPTHRFVEAVHPSPLSAHAGFFGSKIFSKTNLALKELGLSPIVW